MTSEHNASLEGSVSLVTGAAGGLGRATCVAFAEAGSIVIGADLAPKPEGLDVDLWLSLDVTSEESWRAAAARIEADFGRLDCLVNNAAIITLDSLEDTTIAEWRRIQAVNVESVLLSFQALLPLLRTAGAERFGGASVVNITSPAGVLGSPYSGAYAASKAAVANLTWTAVREFGKLGYPIRLNVAYPGGAGDMGMADTVRRRYRELGLAPESDEEQPLNLDAVPIGRLFDPAEVAAGILFLCSTAASYISGVELPVSGGAKY